MLKYILITFFILLVLAIGGYFAGSRFFGATKTVAKSTNLLNLIASNTPETCTFQSGGTSGTLFLSGGKVRADFASTEGQNTTKSHMIENGINTYLWQEGNPLGIKLPFNAGAGDSTKAIIPTGVIDSSQTYNFACAPWKVDDQVFAVPGQLIFKEPPSPPASASISAQANHSTSSGILIIPGSK